MTAGAAQASQTGTAAGRGWQVEPTPNQPGAGINEFSAVSCTSGRACTAVGSRAASLSSPGFTLAERRSGTSWRVQAIATPKSSTGSSLFAVSCTSPAACTAVGDYDAAGGRVLAVAERWNGSTWRLQPMPRPAKVTQLFGVSCPAVRACTAVGYQNSGTGDAQPLAEAWNGSRWRVQAVPLPHAVPGGALSAVFRPRRSQRHLLRPNPVHRSRRLVRRAGPRGHPGHGQLTFAIG